MLEKFFKRFQHRPVRLNWQIALVVLLWVLVAFVVAQVSVLIAFYVLNWTGVPLIALGETLLQSIAAVAVYLITIVLVIGAPWLLKKRTVTQEELGLTRLPSWLDIGLAPIGLVVYLIIAGTLLVWFSSLPNFDAEQVQEIGFNNLSQSYEYLLAFFTLVIITPIAEEVLFRGYLYGKLRKYVPLWIAIASTSLLFGLVHGQANVAVDTFVLSVVMCSLREVTGSIWSGTVLHMIKNSVAFYALFINPSFLGTIVG